MQTIEKSNIFEIKNWVGPSEIHFRNFLILVIEVIVKKKPRLHQMIPITAFLFILNQSNDGFNFLGIGHTVKFSL
jgi:hypothetical protein